MKPPQDAVQFGIFEELAFNYKFGPSFTARRHGTRPTGLSLDCLGCLKSEYSLGVVEEAEFEELII